MEICNLCTEYGTHCNGNLLDFGETYSCNGYEPKEDNTPTKERKIINPDRDLGHNNSVRREHLNIEKGTEVPSYIKDSPTRVLLQHIVNKIEHKFERCENFLSINKGEISLSYYAEGYYNGRARAFEDVIDLIKDTLEKAYNEELESK